MNNTKSLVRKKVIGTAVFALFALGLALSASSAVQALFIDSGARLTVSGKVISKGASSITISTAGSAVTLGVNSNTVFSPSGFSFGDLVVDDFVMVIAKNRAGPTALALNVKFLGHGSGYGTQGDTVFVENALVTNKTADTFTVSTGSATVTFRVLSTTTFIGDSGELTFAELPIYSRVQVSGTDGASESVAGMVVVNSL